MGPTAPGGGGGLLATCPPHLQLVQGGVQVVAGPFRPLREGFL